MALDSLVTGRPIETLLAVVAPIDERFHLEGQPIVTDFKKQNPDESAFFTCLPGTVNPRGPKGK